MFSLSGNRTFRPTLRASYIHKENFGYLHGSLTPTQKFRISPRVSYTYTEISDNSTGLLHPHRNFGFLHRSLIPTQKFGIAPRVSYTPTQKISDFSKVRISPRVSYTHTEIRNSSPSLLHQHINFVFLHGSLTPTQRFWITSRVFYSHTKISNFSTGFLHPHKNSR